MEEWRAIDGWPYEVSDLGRVRRTHQHRGSRWMAGDPLKPGRTKCGGYPFVVLSDQGRQKTAKIHILMAKAFLGFPPPGRSRVLHWDGDVENLSLINLRWGTQKENIEDARRHGRIRTGERCSYAKLTLEQVEAFRAGYAATPKPRQAFVHGQAHMLGVSPSTLYQIAYGKNWVS